MPGVWQLNPDDVEDRFIMAPTVMVLQYFVVHDSWQEQ
jgi:hypothetical protein